MATERLLAYADWIFGRSTARPVSFAMRKAFRMAIRWFVRPSHTENDSSRSRMMAFGSGAGAVEAGTGGALSAANPAASSFSGGAAAPAAPAAPAVASSSASPAGAVPLGGGDDGPSSPACVRPSRTRSYSATLAAQWPAAGASPHICVKMRSKFASAPHAHVPLKSRR